MAGDLTAKHNGRINENESEVFAFMALLKACTVRKALDEGCRIHAHIVKKGLQNETFIANTLVDMYAKCGFLSTAQEIFDDLPVKDAVSWNILTAGYVEHGYSDTTLYLLEQMQRMGIHPNNVTLVCSLKACGSIRATLAGNEICEEIVQKVVERDYFIGNTLVDMYAKCTNCRIC